MRPWRYWSAKIFQKYRNKSYFITTRCECLVNRSLELAPDLSEKTFLL